MGEARRDGCAEGLLIPFEAFVREHLPPLTGTGLPARLLEVGCGPGELTTALAVAGYDVLGIDPAAPHGEHFRRLTLEELDERGPYDGVIAARSLHHIRDLDAALDKVASLLRPNGVLLVDEFAWDRLDGPTLRWLWEQRRPPGAAGNGEGAASVEALREDWEADHLGLHGEEPLRRALAARFDQQAFEWTPYLYRLLGVGATEVLERALVDAGEIQALGFRYAGRPRT